MSDTINDERLQDYVDGLLSEADAAAVERWLADDADGRATVDFLRTLRREAAELPREIAPQRDLWTDIRRRMAPAPLAAVAGATAHDESAAAPSWWPRLQPSQWAALAAAAMFLVVTSSAITAWVVGVPASPAVGADDPAAVTTDVALDDELPLEARYGMEIDELLWTLYENRETLDPDTVSTIETNLRVINRAISSAREALAEDPGNEGLNRLLDNNYERKLELLRRANRIIEMS
ncbi:MAG: hypothetical protein PVJ49_10980 [Acidobacteriota bacterium]|jgi:hypothetical protein